MGDVKWEWKICMEILGQRMLALRLEKGLTQKEAAVGIGISFNSYCRYELSERQPKLPVVCDIADFFDVSLDYLAGRTEYREVVH